MTNLSTFVDPQKTIVGPHRSEHEWEDLRYLDTSRNPPFVLGASVAGVVCGVDRYKTKLELYHEIVGNAPPREPTEAMYWGLQLEEPIINGYERRVGLHVDRPNRMYMLADAPYVAATPDGIGEDSYGRFCVEAKTSSGYMFSREDARVRDCFGEGEDEIPSSYLLQCHQQMLVLDCDRCDMPVLFDGRELRLYSIRRHEEIIRTLLENLRLFANCVLGQQAPDPDFEHESTLKLLKSMYGVEEGTEMDLPPDALEWYQKWQAAKTAEAIAANDKDVAQAHLLHIMADCQRCRVPSYGTELYRSVVKPSLWSQQDIDKARHNLGQVKREQYVRFSERKLK